MNISDEQLDGMIQGAKDAIVFQRFMDRTKGIEKYAALLHILETYRDMPKTADGVRVKPGDAVWVVSPFSEVASEVLYLSTECTDVRVQDCYSTREAAEAAKASGE
jgi:hypothetical protein